MALLAPMPSARATSAARAVEGVRRRLRSPKRTSFQRVSIPSSRGGAREPRSEYSRASFARGGGPVNGAEAGEAECRLPRGGRRRGGERQLAVGLQDAAGALAGGRCAALQQRGVV